MGWHNMPKETYMHAKFESWSNDELFQLIQFAKNVYHQLRRWTKSHKSQTHIKVKSSFNNSQQENVASRETIYFEFQVLDGVQ